MGTKVAHPSLLQFRADSSSPHTWTSAPTGVQVLPQPCDLGQVMGSCKPQSSHLENPDNTRAPLIVLVGGVDR